MACANCGTDNPGGASFCMGCGSALATACSSCGTELPPNAAFCFSCGAQVGAPAAAAARQGATAEADEGLRRYIPPELLNKLEFAAESGTMQGERRTVTMLFCDVKGSTSAARNLDPEEWADIMNGAFEHLIAPVYRYEGTIARLMGDAILAFFGAPIGHEDDPERAVLAALAILDEIEPYKAAIRRDWGIDFDVRVGINTGLVVVGAVGSDLRVEYTAMGDAVNLAARMEQTAAPGTIQITGTTRSLIDKLFEFEDLGGVEVKGHDDPVAAFRVLGAQERPDTIRGIEGLEAPLIGRDAEMAALRDAIDALSTGGQGRIISVTGEAGVGKSRLVADLKSALPDGVAWHEGRSLSYETESPYSPVRRMLLSLMGLSGGEPSAEVWRKVESAVAAALPGRVADVAPFVAWMLETEPPTELAHRTAYLKPPQLRSESFRAIIELIEGLAATAPLVIAFEDLHWADPASLDLVRELLGVADRARLSLVLMFRPRREDGSWEIHETVERDRPHLYTHVALLPLAESETRELVAALLAVDGLDEANRRIILDKSEGNPFFVEEIIRSMIDTAIVAHDGSKWVATGAQSEFSVPDNLSALLVTRLDRLDERCRRVAQAASVVGRQFQYDELAATLPDIAGLDDALVDLQRRDIVREVTRIPKRRYRFKHALLQEAAYDTVLLKQRTQLHGALADFLERLHPERSGDIADHLVKSRQMGRALPYLVAAGESAAAGYALPVAVARFEQALTTMDETTPSPLLRRTLEGLGKTREYLFDFPGAAEAYERLRIEGEQRGDVAMRISGMNKRGLVRGFFFAERQQALDDLVSAEEMAREADDGTGLVEACINQCYLRTGYAEFDEVEYYMAEVARLGDEMGDTEPTLFGMAHFANTLAFLTRFDEALEAAEKLLARAEEEGNLHYQAEMLTFAIPTCHARNGDFAAAMAAVERGMEIAQRIGDRTSEAYAATFQGKVA
ncbi:AAA family ATPase, partial [bacterium]|nr:AAA family ATPase [bacterium]